MSCGAGARPGRSLERSHHRRGRHDRHQSWYSLASELEGRAWQSCARGPSFGPARRHRPADQVARTARRALRMERLKCPAPGERRLSAPRSGRSPHVQLISSSRWAACGARARRRSHRRSRPARAVNGGTTFMRSCTANSVASHGSGRVSPDRSRKALAQRA
jgi:hypothetical protein